MSAHGGDAKSGNGVEIRRDVGGGESQRRASGSNNINRPFHVVEGDWNENASRNNWGIGVDKGSFVNGVVDVSRTGATPVSIDSKSGSSSRSDRSLELEPIATSLGNGNGASAGVVVQLRDGRLVDVVSIKRKRNGGSSDGLTWV